MAVAPSGENDRSGVAGTVLAIWPAGIAVVYTLGFVVANLHYSAFGYVTVAIASTVYVAAGVWAGLLLWVGACTVFAHQQAMRGLKAKLPRRIVWIAWPLASVLVGSLIPLVSAQLAPRVGSGPLQITATVLMAVLVIASIDTEPCPPADLDVLKGVTSLMGRKGKALLAGAPSAAALLVLYLYLVAAMWGQVNATFGGGRPVGVSVDLDSLASGSFRGPGSPGPIDSLGVMRALLLAREADDLVLTAPPEWKATLVPRRYVRWIAFDPLPTGIDSSYKARGASIARVREVVRGWLSRSDDRGQP